MTTELLLKMALKCDKSKIWLITLVLNLDSIMICYFVHLASKFVDEILKIFAVLILVCRTLSNIPALSLTKNWFKWIIAQLQAKSLDEQNIIWYFFFPQQQLPFGPLLSSPLEESKAAPVPWNNFPEHKDQPHSTPPTGQRTHLRAVRDTGARLSITSSLVSQVHRRHPPHQHHQDGNCRTFCEIECSGSRREGESWLARGWVK